MKCPKCHSKMEQKKNTYYCIHCGYTPSGYYIQKGLTEAKKTKLEQCFQTHFHKILYNSNFYIPLIFGPYYLGYCQLFLLGLILSGIELAIFFCCATYISFQTALLLIILIHAFYSIYANQICVTVWKKRLEKKPDRKFSPSIVYPFLIIFILSLIILLIFYLYMKNIIPHA